MNGVEDSYPLTPVQEGMLFHGLQSSAAGIYVQQLVCDLHEALDVAAFRGTWDRLVARHAVLRTAFRLETGSRPVQEVRRRATLPFELHDWRELSAEARTARREAFLRDDRRRGFRLDGVPPLRLTLFRLEEARYGFVFTHHHALLDGRSCRLLVEELFERYEAAIRDEESDAEAPRPYGDFVRWLERRDLGAAETFWRDALDGLASPTTLSLPHEAEPEQGAERFGTRRIVLPEAATSALGSLASAHGITPHTLVQGAWALLLGRYSGQRDVVFGATRACRRSALPGAESMLGVLINTLPVRTTIDGEAPLLDWLREIRRRWVAMRDHEHAPLVRVREWSGLPAGSALFDSVLVFESYRLSAGLEALGGGWLHRDCRLHGMTNYPFTVAASLDRELWIELTYDRARCDDVTGARIARHLRGLLDAFVRNPDARLDEIPLLTERERRRVLVDWNDTAADYPRDACLHHLFEAQAARTPDRPAVLSEGGEISYAELERTANALAHRLVALGVDPEAVVGVCTSRRPEMVVGLLAIMKAGGAYLPLDPAHPDRRLELMIDDAGVRLVLTESALLERLSRLAAQTLCLDAVAYPRAAGRRDAPIVDVRADDLVYVIYTSGSSGEPKGVAVEHRSLVNYTLAAIRHFGIGPADRRLQFSAIGFDVSAAELYTALLAGATVVLWPDGASSSLRGFAAFVERWNVTIASPPTAYWHELVSELSHETLRLPPSLRLLIVGSEEALPDRLAAWHALVGPDVRWCNAYGPTECTISSTFYESTARSVLSGPVPIGRPVDNTTLYLLDDRMEPVPIGVKGEIYIGGDAPARGYLGRPEPTAKSFVPDPFGRRRGARLYRTGDLGRFLPDGNVEFHGRVDRQVQIRGHRVEPGEVERALARDPAVERCVVTADTKDGDTRLSAYLVAAPGCSPTSEALRRGLSRTLPEHMIPARFVTLEALPLDRNGKIDRSRLPSPESGRPTRRDDDPDAPSSALERELKAIWEAVLEIEDIGVRDDFFELGGHSLTAFRIAARVERAIGRPLSPAALFEAPTVERLAATLGDGGEAGSSGSPRRAGDDGIRTPSSDERNLSEHALVPKTLVVHDPVAAGAFEAMTALGRTPEVAREFLFREVPDVARYAAQHETLVRELRRHGPDVRYLHDLVDPDAVRHALRGNPNQVFTRDSVITFPWIPDGYVRSRMRPASRRTESSTMSAALTSLGLREILEVPEGLFVEGGDVVPLDLHGRRTLLVGYGPRTSYRALEFLAEAFLPGHADEILGLELADWRMNLDGGLLFVAEDVVVTDRASILGATAFDSSGRREVRLWELLDELGVNVVETTRQESVLGQACNCVCLGSRRVVCYDLCDRVDALLRGYGIETCRVPGSELVKGRGGPRCMTRPVYG